MSRGRAITRTERLARGWPVCPVSSCDRAPMRGRKHGLCRVDYDLSAHGSVPGQVRRLGAAPVRLQVVVSGELAQTIRAAAARQSTPISVSECARTVLATWFGTSSQGSTP